MTNISMPSIEVLKATGMSNEAAKAVAKEYPSIADLLVSLQTHSSENSLRAELSVIRQENKSFRNTDINRLVQLRRYCVTQDADWESFDRATFDAFVTNGQEPAPQVAQIVKIDEVNKEPETCRPMFQFVGSNYDYQGKCSVSRAPNDPVRANKMDRFTSRVAERMAACDCACDGCCNF